MDFHEFAQRASELWAKVGGLPLLRLGDTRLTVGTLLYLLVLGAILVVGSDRLRRWLAARLIAARGIEDGVGQAVAQIVRYAVLALGFVILIQVAGIDLTALNVLAGAAGIGLGFGMQNIINNFVSGLIVLIERPVKVGDRIEVAGVLGNVVSINARSTTIETNDRIAIIVPNSKFITETVINWSHRAGVARFRIPVTVAAESDVHEVERLLLAAAASVDEVLDDPAPSVRLLKFVPDGLFFELRAWSEKLLHRKGRLTHLVNVAILRELRGAGIAMPNPQRDLHVRGPIAVQQVAAPRPQHQNAK